MAANRHRVEDICDEALRLDAASRPAFLDRACADDVNLRREVDDLLSYETAADGLLSQPGIFDTLKELSEHERDLTGGVLGPYTIIGKLGEGGMGVVYRAHDTRLDRDVALKLVTRAGSSGSLARLRSEARTVARLNHPNICAVYEIAAVRGVACIAMALVDGTPLSAAIPNGGLPPDRVCRIGEQTAAALAHAHHHGVVHRDLKSANVILGPDDRVTVIDFGIAARATRPADQTETGEVFGAGIAGTLSYLAPELLNGSSPDGRSDLWSLGVLLFEMATGRLPFAGSTAPKLAAVILRDSYPELPAGLPPRLRNAIEQCLAKNPADRPSSAAAVATLLATDPVSPKGRHNMMVAIASAVLAVAAVALGGYAWTRPNAGADAFSMRLGNPRPVTTATGVEEFAAWSPDGRTLAYAASTTGNFNDRWDIWVTPFAGGAPINRTEGFGKANRFPSWSPDGTLISFWSDQNGGGCYVMPALGGSPRLISSAAALDPNPAEFSADGQSLSCVTGTVEQTALTTVFLDSGTPTSTVELPGGRQRRMFVTRSSDGRRIALTASSAGLDADVAQLVVYDVATKTERAVTDGRSKAWSPFWSQDGRSLFFVDVSGSSMDLKEQRFTAGGDLDGAPRSLTTGVGMRSAALSPDGKKLAYSIGRKVGNVYRVPYRPDRVTTWADAEQLTFDQASVQCIDLDSTGTRLALSSDRNGSFDIWTMPARGSTLTQITADPSAEWCPTWSPDDKAFVFFAYRSGNRDIWTVPVTGGQWKQVTTDPDPDLHPRWMPDGKGVVYLSGRGNATATWMSTFDGSPDRMVYPSLTGADVSPVDRRIAGNVGGRLALVDLDTGRLLQTFDQAPSDMRRTWSQDGRYVIARSGADRLSLVSVSDGTSRPFVDLSGRRGSLNVYGTPNDARFLYFIWEENLGDIWTMDVQPQ